MKGYCLCRIWKFHGLLEDSFKSTPDNFDISGQAIGRYSPQTNSEASFEIKRRIFTSNQIEERGHDIHPAIELIANEEYIKIFNEKINKYICEARKLNSLPLGTNGSSKLNLCHFQLRITDYGYLVIYAVYDFESIENAVKFHTDITRELTKIILGLTPLFDYLNQEKIIKYASHYFGIPLSFSGLLNIDETDSYVYAEHLFLLAEDKKNLKYYLELLNEELEEPKLEQDLKQKYFAIYNINSIPIWFFDKAIIREEIPYYLESDVRIMAETHSINFAASLFSEISKFLLSNNEKTFFRRIKSKKTKKSYSEVLRNVSLNYAFTLQQIRYRYSDFETWQTTYEDLIKDEDYGLDDAENPYKVSETNLSNLISAIEAQETSKHQKRIEILFLLFAGITIASVYVDIVSFIEVNQSNFTQLNTHFLETKFLIFLMLFVLAFIMIITRRKRY